MDVAFKGFCLLITCDRIKSSVCEKCKVCCLFSLDLVTYLGQSSLSKLGRVLLRANLVFLIDFISQLSIHINGLVK